MGDSLIFLGSGGHAKSIYDSLSEKEKSLIIGYVDLKTSDFMEMKNINYLGNDDYFIENFVPSNNKLVLGVSYIGKKPNFNLRSQLLYKYRKFEFYKFISKKSYVSIDSQIGEGSIILNDVFINSSVQIGSHCLINNRVLIEHDCEIGNNVQISPGAIILGGSRIGNNCFIGAGSIIRDSVNIIENTIIGMGSIVTKDILQNGTYVGKPIYKL
jgi:sugar O-acyltransferase (sialic acid O-acetyltransferase NeuD family)